MKTISVVVPTYNEEDNVMDVYRRIRQVFSEKLPDYRLKLQFIDNCSTDHTRELIRSLCERDEDVQAIFNAKNFGYNRSLFYGLSQAEGDCAVLINADMQDPPEVIPRFVAEWEAGYKIVAGVKTQSRENPVMYFFRSIYYYLMKHSTEIDHIEHFDGFGLYDQEFIRVLREMDDPLPYLRGIVAELGFKRKDIEYEQVKRKKGKTHFRFFALYDLAMLGITSYSKVIMHCCTILGGILAVVSALIAVVTLFMKLFAWDSFPMGTAAMVIGIFFLGAVQLFFIGFVGEYVVNINARVMRHPLVVEETRLNFETENVERLYETKITQ
ncbi:MAG: glycosyltransferase [Provencibacterium sp.]|jgi:glycosyltransferase involved in cell wall biosynthesis|nr:glycosyltransferase [Provencibacterium sp.]